MIDNGNSKPLYEQLKNEILNKIYNSELLPGDLLPSERRLSEMYNISRVTVRQCIALLVNEGVLRSVHGKGTYVLKKKVQSTLGSLIGVAEELATDNNQIDIEVISKEVIQAVEIADILNLDENQEIFCLVRRIKLAGQPVVINYTYMSTALRTVYNLIDLNKDIIYYGLEQFGYKIYDAEQTITAGMPEDDEYIYLESEENYPVLVLDRVTRLEGGTPIIYEKSVYRADMYEYKINLRRSIETQFDIRGGNINA